MNIKNFYKETTKSIKIDYVFYIAVILLAASILAYFLFTLKVSIQTRQISDIDTKMLALGSGERQTYNEKIFGYKNRIDDFATLISNHAITSGVFGFIEDNTLSRVQFTSFSMQQDNYEIILSGQAASLELLSRQIKNLEVHEDYVKSITVLNAQSESEGVVTFSISMMFDPAAFNYEALVTPPEPPAKKNDNQ